MELPSLSIVDDEELMEEALAILDSVDIERLGASALVPTRTLPEPRAGQHATATDEDLLKTAIQAVHAAYPQHGQQQLNNSKSPNQQQKTATTNQDERGSARPALHVSTAAASTGNIKPVSRRNSGGRTRMREQLIQLRSVVQKMENHLETLRSPRSPRFIDTTDKSDVVLVTDENDSTRINGKTSETDISDDAAVWRNIAMQQFHARRKAEQQNVELRESLEAQIQLSKQVESLLQAHPMDPVSASCV
ncbi:unnamed protein product [Phytophthora fragariaefolia]|uniref:Unnamed protein product n=1 Tax=Phytophthora fragariaefolia TaxID=1490495 RepID=A0A9W6XIU4_9STRA|nr:unnamed protein product [Phytophthora fragariaefolia]